MNTITINFPKITVVTVVFNGRSCIEKTIKSVIEQSYPNIEYIIIDGGSTDGTIEIIKKYEKKIDYWLSKKDAGIYDAMNTGINKATGRYINFMNAGDTFFTSDTLKEIFSCDQKNANIIYGSVEIEYHDLVRIETAGSPDRLWSGMQFSHQAAFVETAYLQSHPFNLANRIAADLEFFYQAYRAGASFFNCNKIVCRVITGGLSEVHRVNAILSSCAAICGQSYRPFIRIFYFGRLINSVFRSIIKLLLPRYLVRKFILMK